MKRKITGIIAVILTVLTAQNVKAYETYEGTFYEAEKIEGVFYYKHRDDTATEKYEYHNFHSQASIYRKTEDNNIVYCVESWAPISGAPNGSHLIMNKKYPSEWDYEVATRVEALAYYGYGYKENGYDHTNPIWYAITQYLIWETASSHIDHYFVSSISSSTPINPFDAEIKELNDLVNSHITKPMFDDYANKQNINVGEKTHLKDIRNVLKNYQRLESSTLKIEKINDSEIVITASKEGNHTMYLYQSYDYYNKPYTYYHSSNYQDMLEPGNIPLRKETVGFYAKNEEIILPEENDDLVEDNDSSSEDIGNVEMPPIVEDNVESSEPKEEGGNEGNFEMPPMTDDNEEESNSNEDEESGNFEMPPMIDEKEEANDSEEKDDNKDLEENEKDKNPPIIDDEVETPDTSDDAKEETSSPNEKDENIDDDVKEEDNKPSDIENTTPDKIPEDILDDKDTSDEKIPSIEIDVIGEDKTEINKNDPISLESSSTNDKTISNLEKEYEGLEVEVPATSASTLSIFFYILSFIILLIIHHDKKNI